MVSYPPPHPPTPASPADFCLPSQETEGHSPAIIFVSRIIHFPSQLDHSHQQTSMLSPHLHTANCHPGLTSLIITTPPGYCCYCCVVLVLQTHRLTSAGSALPLRAKLLQSYLLEPSVPLLIFLRGNTTPDKHCEVLRTALVKDMVTNVAESKGLFLGPHCL